MNYTEQMQDIADRYTKETGATRYTARELAAWAIKTRQWEPQPSMLIKQCAEDFSKALREHYIRDARGGAFVPSTLLLSKRTISRFQSGRISGPLVPVTCRGLFNYAASRLSEIVVS
jgi:hypothetical protein